ELEAQTSGLLSEILVTQGRSVSVGSAIAMIESPAESPAELLSPDHPPTRPTAAPEAGVDVDPAPPRPAPRSSVPATPRARELARENLVDLTAVVGSGADGLITGEDVLRHARSTSSSPKGVPAPERV